MNPTGYVLYDKNYIRIGEIKGEQIEFISKKKVKIGNTTIKCKNGVRYIRPFVTFSSDKPEFGIVESGSLRGEIKIGG